MRIGIAGLGTVGGGVLRLLRANADLLTARTGRALIPAAVSVRDPARSRGLDLDGVRIAPDAAALAEDPEIDLVCEAIGGADGAALDLARRTLRRGKPVVTANKAMLALHGAELAQLAEANRTTVMFEAAVAGGIPIVKSLREGLAGNRITRVAGILNGTCNYILTAMRETRRDFSEVLAEAQAFGYAEADASADIDGIDAAHKLALLAALAFGGRPRFDAIHVEGIRSLAALDIAFAGELGYRIKLLGVARMTTSGLEQRLHPCMIPIAAPIAQVEGVFNGVVVEGDAVGTCMFEGRGAGAGPTASAIVADIVDIARRTDREPHPPVFGVPAAALADHPIAPMAAHTGSYYARLVVIDRPGVLAEIATALRDQRVSIESLIQRGRNPEQPVSIVLTSHETSEAAMRGAMAQIAGCGSVVEPPRLIRIEPP